MLTIEQIKAVHSKVKSGADFPAYIRDLIALGVAAYDTYVTDGHTDYYDKQGQVLTSAPKYSKLDVSDDINAGQFKADLKAHQQGHTDYPAFCSDCAKSGVEKWIVSMKDMTCTYYSKAGNEMLTEQIPQ